MTSLSKLDFWYLCLLLFQNFIPVQKMNNEVKDNVKLRAILEPFSKHQFKLTPAEYGLITFFIMQRDCNGSIKLKFIFLS